MDAGSKVGWPARKFPHELSAIQHAYGLRQDNPDTFDAEYQNEPKSEIDENSDLRMLNSTEFCLRTYKTHKRLELPLWTEYLTLGVDVQENSLWWVLLASGANFQSIITDYGVWPEQGDEYVTLSNLNRSIARATGVKRPADAIVEALRQLTKFIFGREYLRDDGAAVPITRGLVDSGYRKEAIYRFCQETSYPIMPVKGEGIGAKNKPWDEIPIKRVRNAAWAIESHQSEACEFLATYWLTRTVGRRSSVIALGTKIKNRLEPGLSTRLRQFTIECLEITFRRVRNQD